LLKSAQLHCLPMSDAGDVATLTALIDGGVPVQSIKALWCKTDGTGLLNDYSRGYAELALAQFLAARLDCSVDEIRARIQIVVSGGAEGIVSPHLLVLAEAPGDAPPRERGLVAGLDRRAMSPLSAGTHDHALATADMVRCAALDAGLSGAAEAKLIVIRSPASAMNAASVRAARLAAAAGVGLATGHRSDLPDDLSAIFDGPSNVFVVARWDDLEQQVVVLGNAPGARSPQIVASGALRDPLDSTGVARVLAELGIAALPQASAADAARIASIIMKGDPPVGSIRGWAHGMSNDPTLPGHRQARAAYAAMAAAIAGVTTILASGGAEGHGPADGGLIAIVASSACEQKAST
jgi:cyanuric acid amidohydrolase